MTPIRLLASTLSVLALFCSTARADSYPAKPVELVVGYAAGGGTDVLARAFADAVRTSFQQPFVVINKPGGSGTIALSYVATAPADGYKAIIIGADLMAMPYIGIGKATYEDFQPVARFTADPAAVTVSADSPWKSIEEFIAYAKANPGTVSISDAGRGTGAHLAAAFLGERTSATFNHVPYQGNAPALMGLLGGQVMATTIPYGEVKSYVEAGKLRTLALMGEERLPGVAIPTLKERGVDLSSIVWRGIAVAKDTPPDVVAKLSAVAEKAMSTASFRDMLVKQNLTISYAPSEELKRDMLAQDQEYKQLLPKLKLKD